MIKKDVGNLISGSSAFSKSSLNNLEVHGSRTIEAWLGEFWTVLVCEMSAIVQ